MIPASHQVVYGYNLRQWRCLLGGEIWSFTRKPHIYKTLLDVPSARLASKPHSFEATFNCSMSTRMGVGWGGVRKEEVWRRRQGNSPSAFDADELASTIILGAKAAANNSSCIWLILHPSTSCPHLFHSKLMNTSVKAYFYLSFVSTWVCLALISFASWSLWVCWLRQKRNQ